MPATALRKKALTLISVRFSTEDRQLLKLLRARAAASDRSVSGGPAQSTTLGSR